MLTTLTGLIEGRTLRTAAATLTLPAVVAPVLAALAWVTTPLDALTRVLRELNLPAAAATAADWDRWTGDLPTAAVAVATLVVIAMIVRACVWFVARFNHGATLFWVAIALAVQTHTGPYVIGPVVAILIGHALTARTGLTRRLLWVVAPIGLTLAPATVAMAAGLWTVGLDADHTDTFLD